jgi:DNA-binding NarL/FixJ family response regulator
VFARLSADLTWTGCRVQRACTAHGVWQQLARCRPELVIVNMETLDESGWLLASKLWLTAPAVRVWIYTPRLPSPADLHFARFLGVELIYYGGDLTALATEVLRRALDPARADGVCDARNRLAASRAG